MQVESEELIGSGVADSSGAIVLIGRDQGGIVCPAWGVTKMPGSKTTVPGSNEET